MTVWSRIIAASSSGTTTLRGFGSFESAARFCTAPDELRKYRRPRRTTGETISLARQRQLFRGRWTTLMRLIAA